MRVGLIMRSSLALDALERALAGCGITVAYRASSPLLGPSRLPSIDALCIRAETPPTEINPRLMEAAPVLVLTPSVHRADVLAMLKIGVRGYMHEDILIPDLADAILAVARGAYRLCPEARAALLNNQLHESLTYRQRQIVDLIAHLRRRGLKVDAGTLAQHLQVSPKTVYAHLYQIATALGLAASVQAVIEYAEKL
jgi:DNA-binding NarL/FixJ family response regulator